MRETLDIKVPELRFPEFSGEWSTSSLSQMSLRITGGARNWAQFYDESGVLFLRMTNLPKEGIRLIKSDLKYVHLPGRSQEEARTSVMRGDILMSITAELGKIGLVTELEEGGYINQHTALIRTTNAHSSRFTAHHLSSWNSRVRINRLNDSGAKAALNLSTVGKIGLSLPTLPEQQKIAEFLTAVDEKIGKLKRKKELLEDYKKGAMQKLFSQEIRFKDDQGNPYPDWEEKRLGEVYRVTRGKVLATSEVYEHRSENQPYPVYSSQTKADGLLGFYSQFLFDDAITWTTDGANAGKVSYRTGKFYCTNVCGVLLSDQGYSNNCMAQHINRITHRYVSYVGNPKLMNNVMSDIKITFPTLPEQQKIAEFLTGIDDKINAVANQIDQAAQFKKGLLQKMFV